MPGVEASAQGTPISYLRYWTTRTKWRRENTMEHVDLNHAPVEKAVFLAMFFLGLFMSL